jgi:hypothetical protein
MKRFGQCPDLFCIFVLTSKTNYKMKFQFKFFAVFCGAVFLMCSCQQKQQENRRQETPDAEVPSHTQIVQMGIQKMTHWVDHWQMQGRDFDKTAFRFAQEVEYELLEWPEENHPDANYPLRKFQFPHPEDKGVVDLYDYKIDLGESGRVGLNPDSEVAYFRANGMKERLLFFGPSGVFEDAVWVTGSHLLVAGHVREGDYTSPRLWLIMPDEQVYMEYHHPFISSTYLPEQYLKKKLASIELP